MKKQIIFWVAWLVGIPLVAITTVNTIYNHSIQTSLNERLAETTPVQIENFKEFYKLNQDREWGDIQWATAWWCVDNDRGDLALYAMSDHMTPQVWKYYRPLIQDLYLHEDEYTRAAAVYTLAQKNSNYDMFRNDPSAIVQMTIKAWDSGEGVDYSFGQ